MNKFMVLCLCFVCLEGLAQQYDPMMPAYLMKKPVNKESVKVRQKTYYEVNQILMSKKDRLAIVNGRIVRKGDWIQSAQVIAIEKDRVLLNKSGKVLTLLIEKRMPKVRTN